MHNPYQMALTIDPIRSMLAPPGYYITKSADIRHRTKPVRVVPEVYGFISGPSFPGSYDLAVESFEASGDDAIVPHERILAAPRESRGEGFAFSMIYAIDNKDARALLRPKGADLAKRTVSSRDFHDALGQHLFYPVGYGTLYGKFSRIAAISQDPALGPHHEGEYQLILRPAMIFISEPFRDNHIGTLAAASLMKPVLEEMSVLHEKSKNLGIKTKVSYDIIRQHSGAKNLATWEHFIAPLIEMQKFFDKEPHYSSATGIQLVKAKPVGE